MLRSYKPEYWPKVRPVLSHPTLLMTLCRSVSAECRWATGMGDLLDEDGRDGGRRLVWETVEVGSHLR